MRDCRDTKKRGSYWKYAGLSLLSCIGRRGETRVSLTNYTGSDRRRRRRPLFQACKHTLCLSISAFLSSSPCWVRQTTLLGGGLPKYRWEDGWWRHCPPHTWAALPLTKTYLRFVNNITLKKVKLFPPRKVHAYVYFYENI